jgi:tetratricopeptide (TPR) repeat protein
VLFVRSQVFLEQERYDRAVRDLDAILKIDPTAVLAHIQKGCVYREMGDHRSAVQSFDASLALDATDAQVWWWRGLAKAALGDAAGAEADKAQARKLDPKVGVAAKPSGASS